MQLRGQVAYEKQIVEMIDRIYQNVGIKRYIDNISILQNEQIYFQICNIFVPWATMKLHCLNEDRELGTGQKIQGVIDLIANYRNIDLDHISGQNIFEGKVKDTWNFFHLCDELSEEMYNNYDRIEIHSAPPTIHSRSPENEEIDYPFSAVFGVGRQSENDIAETATKRTDPLSESLEQSQYEHSEVNPQHDLFHEVPLYAFKTDRLKPQLIDAKEQPPFQDAENQKNHSLYNPLSNAKYNLHNHQHFNPYAHQQPNPHSLSSSKDSSEEPIPPIAKIQPKPPITFTQQQILTNKPQLNKYPQKIHKLVQQLEKRRIHNLNIELESWIKKENYEQRFIKNKIAKQMQERNHLVKSKHKKRTNIIKSSFQGQKEAIKAAKLIFLHQKKLENKLNQTDKQLLFEEDLLTEQLQKAVDSSQHQYRSPKWLKGKKKNNNLINVS